jgi:hypothetical protein
MLHMLVARHGPQTCAAVVPEFKDKASFALKGRDKVAKKLGITIQGAWANMPAHIIYFVCDAPNAHVVNQMAVELQLMDWNTVTVSPIITFGEVQSRLQKRKR